MGLEKHKRAVQAPQFPVTGVTTASTGTNIFWNENTALTLTTGAAAYSLNAPNAAGDICELYSITGSSGNKTCTVIFATTGVYFLGSSGQTNLRKLTFNAGNEAVILRAHSATQVQITSNQNSVAIAAT